MIQFIIIFNCMVNNRFFIIYLLHLIKNICVGVYSSRLVYSLHDIVKYECFSVF